MKAHERAGYHGPVSLIVLFCLHASVRRWAKGGLEAL